MKNLIKMKLTSYIWAPIAVSCVVCFWIGIRIFIDGGDADIPTQIYVFERIVNDKVTKHNGYIVYNGQQIAGNAMSSGKIILNNKREISEFKEIYTLHTLEYKNGEYVDRIFKETIDREISKQRIKSVVKRNFMVVFVAVPLITLGMILLVAFLITFTVWMDDIKH